MALNPEDVSLAYRLILGRNAAPAEVTDTLGRYDSLATLRQAFLGSAEFVTGFRKLMAEADSKIPPTLIHLHIPETTGPALAEALSAAPHLQPNMVLHDETLPGLAALPRGKRRGLRYLHGHLSMGSAVGEVLDGPHRYMTLIRRAGPRIFSFYRFVRDTPAHPSSELLRKRKMSFGDYLDFSQKDASHRVELDNGQLRRLGGLPEPGSLGREPELLRAALHNIFAPRMIFGFVEHLDLFAQRLVEEGTLALPDLKALKPPPLPEGYDAAVAALTPAQRAIFEAYTAWDSYLYDLCAGIFLPPVA